MAQRIGVRPGIERFTDRGVVFEDREEEERFDAVVLATGYRHQLERLLGDTSGLLDGSGRPRARGRETALAGLYLCGFFVAPTGMLREIGREARVIAEDIARRCSRRHFSSSGHHRNPQ